MIEVYGNLWDYPADARVITTNGFVKKNGEAVMGRGCAKEVKDRWPIFPKDLGRAISRYGNTVLLFSIEIDNVLIFTFPVKHNWWEKADLELIEQSTKELAEEVKFWEIESVVLPRPGCGNGGRDWETEVKPILEKYLDDRFKVITYG